jgi:hypothetical protein
VSAHTFQREPALGRPAALGAPDFVPAEWERAAAAERPRAPGRDLALDLVRGLAMLILVVNHLHLRSPLSDATSAILSAAEVLVTVSGVVAGMVFGGRWLREGPRATTAMLLRRARKLYLASVVVVALVGALTLVPWLASDALTVSPTMSSGADLYAFDGAARTMLAILTLEAGPWQFSILGLFIALLAVTPAILWLLARGGWPLVLVASWVLFVAGREWQVDVLPAQSERAFPILVWQILFVHGLVLGWYRDRVAGVVSRNRRACAAIVAGAACAFAGLQLAAPAIVEAGTWSSWRAEHFDKGTLDVARIAAMLSIAAAIYAVLRCRCAAAERLAGPLLLPLGRNSFYVFIMHVFLCLAVASIAAAAGGDLGPAGNLLVQAATVAVLLVMTRRRFLFRWVPR